MRVPRRISCPTSFHASLSQFADESGLEVANTHRKWVGAYLRVPHVALLARLSRYLMDELVGSVLAATARFGRIRRRTRPFTPAAPPVNTCRAVADSDSATDQSHPARLQAGLRNPAVSGPDIPSPFLGGNGGWFPTTGTDTPPLYSNSAEVNVNSPVFVQGGQPEPQIGSSGEITSVLSLTFPPAEIWVDGKKGPGEPKAE